MPCPRCNSSSGQDEPRFRGASTPNSDKERLQCDYVKVHRQQDHHADHGHQKKEADHSYRSMRASSMPLFKVDLGAVIPLFLFRVALPRLVGLSMRALIGLVSGIVFWGSLLIVAPDGCFRVEDRPRSS